MKHKHKKKGKHKMGQHLQKKVYGTDRRREQEAAEEKDTYFDDTIGTIGTEESVTVRDWRGETRQSMGTQPYLTGADIVTGGNNQKCFHRGDVPLFEFDGTTFYPANERGMEHPESIGANLIIDCAGIVRKNLKPEPWVIYSESEPQYESLNDRLRGPDLPPVLRLKWQDFGIPPKGVDLAFWRDLLKILPKGKVVVCCMGGHGRTGTCLASLLIASGMTAKAAIDLVQTKHCSKAIETKGQVDYLYSLEKERL